MSTERAYNRRSFLARVVGAAALGGGAMSLLGAGPAMASTDHDTTDAVGHGRSTSGLTDRDSNDVAGNGRGTGHPPPVRRPFTGRSDHDSTDAPGHGR